MGIVVCNPVQEAVVDGGQLSPRLATLDGKTLGLFSNGKLNADELLTLIGDRLTARYRVEAVVRGTYAVSRAMEPDEWGPVDECDAVVLAVGDCGSCSSSGMMNCVQLERRGIPAVLVSTPPFAGVCRAMAQLGGLPAIQWAIVEHPIGSLAVSELAQRADHAVAQFERIVISADGKTTAPPGSGSPADSQPAESESPIRVGDFTEAVELFHANGWTDGLPVVPPSPDLVEAMLAHAGLGEDEVLGVYALRGRPITAGKLAVNAVMAGCRPEQFPIVVAAVEAMLDPCFPLHMVNSSTGSPVVGFVVNGPVRHAAGMNWSGNVLGPGNRANSSIGRAIRLVQLNVMGSIPGAGSPIDRPESPALDRATMGEPAKYAGYHIAENEEDFSSLEPLHTQLGFDRDDSTVTVYPLWGHLMLSAHAEETPEQWIDTVNHYLIGHGRLMPDGFGVLLLPPEAAARFANAGWRKEDISEAIYAGTRQSISWVKQNGWKIGGRFQRGGKLEPGDDDRFLAAAASPKDIHVVVCGAPAGNFPVFLDAFVSGCRPATRLVRPYR
jgi:hypothetical protein